MLYGVYDTPEYPFQRTVLFLARSLEPMSPESKDIFENMWLAKWRRWLPRYIVLVESAAARVVPTMHPGMRRCERECFGGLMLLPLEPADTTYIN